MKVDAIVTILAPTSKTELRFMSIVTNITKFMPNVSNKMPLFIQMLKSDMPWHLDENMIGISTS